MSNKYKDLDKDCQDAIHDCIYDAFYDHKMEFHKGIVGPIFDRIPQDVLSEGYEWGFSDTVAGDHLYSYVKENLLNIISSIQKSQEG